MIVIKNTSKFLYQFGGIGDKISGFVNSTIICHLLGLELILIQKNLLFFTVYMD